MLPAQGIGLLTPDPLLVGLHLAEAAFGTGLLDDVKLLLDGQVVPLKPLPCREAFGFMQNLLVPLAEGPADILRDGQQHDSLLLGVIADARAQTPELIGEDGLEVGAELLHPRVGESPRVEGSDPAIRRNDHVHQEVMDVHMRVAGDRRIENVGLSPRPILHRERRPGGVMAEADPTDRPRIGAILPAGAFACPAEHVGDVTHGAVAGPVHGIPEHRALGGCGRKLGGKTDRLVRTEDQVEAADLPLVRRPGLTVVGPPPLEEAGHLGVSWHQVGIDPDGSREDGRHVRPPSRPAVPACVVGRQASSLLELAAGGVQGGRVDRLRRILGEISEDQPPLGRGGDLPKVHHARAPPFG